jgi:hypothetical protein
MWADFVEWGRRSFLKPELQRAIPEDLSNPHCVETTGQAIAIIRQRYEQWCGEPTATAK